MNSNLPNETPERASRGAAEAPGLDLELSPPPARRTPFAPEGSAEELPSAHSAVLEALDPPVPHRAGPRAELGSLSARLHAANKSGDGERERVAGAALARALAARGTELEAATRHARHALLLGEDPVLREELAGWFASLGEAAISALTLRPLLVGKKGADAAALHLRLAVLLGRAGDGLAQKEALKEAAREDPSESQALELLGAIGAWAPHAISAHEAAEAYLSAAERRERAGERSGALENLLRAFEVAPDLALSAERLSAVLVQRGRAGAADEVRREHARAVENDGRAVHRQRMQSAFSDGDLARALGAAFDAHLDSELGPEQIGAFSAPSVRSPNVGEIGFDALLARTGLNELLAARLVLASELCSGSERSAICVSLARLCKNSLAQPDRAAEAWLDAVVADPANGDALAGLREHAQTHGDPAPLVEAWLRVAEAGAEPARSESLRELAAHAEHTLSEPALASWALGELLGGAPDADLQARRDRLADALTADEEDLHAAEAELARASGPERASRFSRVVKFLRARPDRTDRLCDLLAEQCELDPTDRASESALERVLARKGRRADLEAQIARRMTGAPEGESARLTLAHAELRRRRGDAAGALSELRPLLDHPAPPGAVASMTLLIAAREGERVLRARALLALASQLGPALRATLTALAAEELLDCEDLSAARLAADQACHAEPSLARAVAARARVGLLTADRWGAEAMERAMGVVVPRAELCRALSTTYEALGEPLLAMAFTQRLLALRPGDLDAARARLERVARAGDAPRLADALAWLLSRPEPLTSLSSALEVGLRTLAELDPARASGLARRALDVLGPRVAGLRDTVLAVADKTGDRGLGIAVVERFLAIGPPAEDRAALLFDLARRRRAGSDADGAARALLRALREGSEAQAILAELELLPATKNSDGELAVLETRAEALRAEPEANASAASFAFRELGSAYLDFASDLPSALRAFERALELNPERGVECFASDLLAFVGLEATLSAVLDLAEKKTAPRARAQVFAVAARVAFGADKLETAFSLSARALDLDPSRADLLALAERAASSEQVDDLEELYRRLADAALGPYGERALHYRAARQLEQRNDVARALDHAILAFEAVPSEGVAFTIMARLAERSAQAPDVVRAIERVALKHSAPELRVSWLRRAAEFAGSSEEGKRQRVELLLSALMVRPDENLVRSLSEALRALLALAIDDREILELRFEHAIAALLPKLSGPEGARIAIACATSALLRFGSARVALSALERALSSDGDLEEFAEVHDQAEFLSTEAPPAFAFVARLVALACQKFGGAGPAVLDLGARIAAALGDRESEARLLIAAAKKSPENAVLLRRAEASARALGNSELREAVLEAIPTAERLEALISIADQAEARQDPGEAIAALERALLLPGLGPEARRMVFERLRQIFRRTEQRAELERILTTELGSADLDSDTRFGLGVELASLVGARGDLDEAMALLRPLVAERPEDRALLAQMAALAGQSGDKLQEAEALATLSQITDEPAERLALLRRSAESLAELGNDQRALPLWHQVLELEPTDLPALAALERDVEQRGDYETLAALLLRRAALAVSVDDRRRVRLRRATVLEQRLLRPDEARAELEVLTAESGDHLSVLRVLADLNERLAAPLRAAPLWLRASAIAQDRSEAADLARRACQAYLNGGDLVSARRVLEGMGAWAQSPKLLELSVEVERRRNNPQALAEALEELAALSQAPDDQRAGWLVEAAQASLSAGLIETALGQATRAARIAPESGAAQLLARRLEYQKSGAGDAAEARGTLAELAGIRGELSVEQRELLAFLRVEALAVARGSNAAEAELERARTELGLRPLIALALAERAADREPRAALELFDRALAGDLCELRSRGRVALAALSLAEQVTDSEHAHDYLAIALEEPATREEARRESERRTATPLGQAATLVSPEVAEDREAATERGLGLHSARPVADLPSSGSIQAAAEMALAEHESGRYAERGEGSEILVPSARASDDSNLPHSVASARPLVSGRYSASPPAEERLSSGASIRPQPVQSIKPPLAAGQPVPDHSKDSPAPARKRDEPRPSGYFPAATSGEAALFEALNEGSIAAGVELVKELENRTSRTQDLVRVCRRVALLAPGDAWAVGKLHRAALADRNLTYARAVEHVLAFLIPERPRVEPPPLADQVEQPDAVRGMLFRDSLGPVQEAMAIVWEGAEHVFRRDASTYGITGMERVPLTAQTPLARLYASAARALSLTRTPLFQRRSSGPITVNLALLSPPAVILSGDVHQDTPELRFHLGAMLAAAIPQYALLFGSPESQARAVLRGLGFAFGPPRQTKSSGVLNLAELLWESIPARFQRRLRQLCDPPERLDYDAALASSRLAVRRAGLFVAGDIAVALYEAAADAGISRSQLAAPNALAELSRTAPSLRNLLTLALSPEYAETRWQFGPRTGTTRF